MNALNLYSLIEEDLDLKEDLLGLYSAYNLLINQLQASSLIDIGCGQGDFLVQLEDKSIQTIGIDLASKQVKICKEKNLNASCMNIKDVKDKYDVATAIFDVLNYMQKDELLRFLSYVYKTLNDGGYFIFDVNSFYGFDQVAQGTLNINKEDKFIAIDAYFNNDILNTDISLFTKEADNKYSKQEETILQYFHDKNYLKTSLQEIGFKVENIVDFNLYDIESADKFIFICRKVTTKN